MHITTIHYCRIHDVCSKNVLLCCRICPRSMQCEESCLNHPDKCGCSTYVCTTEE